MQKNYEAADVQIISLESRDIIWTSNDLDIGEWV